MDTTRWGDAFQSGTQGSPPDQDPSAYQADEYVPSPAGESSDAAYPFEEPEQAPELRFQRSDNLYSRSEPFWEQVIELPKEGEEYPRDPNYWDHPEELADDRILHVDSGRLRDKVKHVLGSRALCIFMAALVVALGMWTLIHNSFMQVKNITVQGQTSIPYEEIVRMSRLEKGMSIFDVDEQVVAENIERSGKLRCTLVDVAFDQVVLHVQERVPVAWIDNIGLMAALDERGWVLEVGSSLSTAPDKLISVKGFDVRRCSVGQPVTLNTPSRLTIFTQILIELRAMKGLDMIVELDMTSMDSISLKTEDGFTVQLGNEKRIHEKLRAMMIVREVVLEKGYYGEEEGGTIVVSDPTSPTFMPSGAQ